MEGERPSPRTSTPGEEGYVGAIITTWKMIESFEKGPFYKRKRGSLLLAALELSRTLFGPPPIHLSINIINIKGHLAPLGAFLFSQFPD